ncbi:hypothetical protein FKM82_002966 [Ascaphus truei]
MQAFPFFNRFSSSKCHTCLWLNTSITHTSSIKLNYNLVKSNDCTKSICLFHFVHHYLIANELARCCECISRDVITHIQNAFYFTSNPTHSAHFCLIVPALSTYLNCMLLSVLEIHHDCFGKL